MSLEDSFRGQPDRSDKHTGLSSSEADEIFGTKDVSLNFLAGFFAKTKLYRDAQRNLEWTLQRNLDGVRSEVRVC